MKFKSTTKYVVSKTDYLDKVFKEIPNNSFTDKGRCAIGGTTLELNNKSRCSIIVVSTIGILKDKAASNASLFIVYGEVSIDSVKEQLSKREAGQKIMTTPEGIKKIVVAAQKLGLWQQMKDEWFLLLDEAHNFACEDYRNDILRPFDYFWEFKNKAIITATPYYFSDQRFSTLDHHVIRFTEPVGKIKLVECISVPGSLTWLIREVSKQRGNIHIFLNSVTEIKLAIQRAGLQEVNIFCANDKDGENMKKLGALAKHFVEQPSKDNFKKVNFYTSRYFEGWDMFDNDATIILVTDIYALHTKVSVRMKLVQAAGRLRNRPKNIFHLTNHHNLKEPLKPHDEFNIEYYGEAVYLIEDFKNYVIRCTAQNIKPKPDVRLEKFADTDAKTFEVKLNFMKLDQQINQAYSEQMYNHINLIEQQWRENHYDVQIFKDNHKLETHTAMKRKSKATELKEDYLTILDYNKSASDGITYFLGASPKERIRVTNRLAYEAATYLSIEVMERLKYNVKAVQKEVILASNAGKELKLMKILLKEFKQGDRVTKKDISNRLQEIYEKLELRNPETGDASKAKATDFINNRWFEVKECKIDVAGHGPENGFIILRTTFGLRVAA